MNLRRSFLYMSAMLTFLSCNRDNPTSPEKESNKRENNYGIYETQELGTDGNGRVKIISEITQEDFDIRTVDPNFNPISNSDVHFYYDDKGNLIISTMIKGDSDYLPGLYHSSYSLEGRINNSDDIYDIISLLRHANSFKDISISFLEDAPSFDENHVLNIPGIIYEGDWSFNESRNFLNSLNKSFMILVPIFPGVYPLAIATRSSITIADKLNDVLDFIDRYTSLEIDKDEKFEFYALPGFNITFFLPKLPNESTRNVEDYIRINQGDWWDYNYGLTLEVDGFKTINGKSIPIFKDNQGTMTYHGPDNVFSRIYGNKIEYNNQTYEFIYQPPINFGDDRLAKGKKYPNSVKDINTGRYIDISYTWIGIDGVTTPAGRFDNCWKVEERSGNDYVLRWLAKDVGQVKIKQGNVELLLENYGSGGLPIGTSSVQDKLDYSYLLLGFVR